MICKSIEQVAEVFAIKIAERKEDVITVNVMQEVLGGKSVLQAVCEADPRLILCISSMRIRSEHYGRWSALEAHISYTDLSPTSISRVDSVSGFQGAAYRAASIHGRELAIVFPNHMYESIQEAKNKLLELPEFLNCFVSGVRSETKRISRCNHMAQIIRFHYSCTYGDWKNRKKEIAQKTGEIIKYARACGIEDWKKAYEVVRYCVKNWRYATNKYLSGLEYTSYGAIVKNNAVCMGIALAVCTIFKELGIPCRYIRGIRNGEGHSWNMIYLRGGWFYIDVTDAICQKDPLFHWGMTSMRDRVLCQDITENLICNCTAEYIRKMTS